MDVSYFGAHGHVPLRVALLLAAVAGSARVIQLRDRPQAPPGRPQGCEAEAKDSSKADYREPATGRDL
ncbi:hypothetical protein [Streptomyces sp. NPDC002763]|uniref:hypothetical protein n=1 Tax=Streptomyces sp. NPDC002763 TaxID=3154427 RepID=UPI003316ABFA